MDIVVWLRSLGLGKYEAAFRENEIDETVLASLTEEHLKQLGVTAIGHRLKLLDAIAALPGRCGRQNPINGSSDRAATRCDGDCRARRRSRTKSQNITVR
jgi:hypothetical protein